MQHKLSNITIRQIVAFVTIAKSQTVNEAAKKLHLSQPALSMAIAELEKYFIDPLFDRRSRRLILNEKGRAFLPYATKLLSTVNIINDKFSKQGDEGHSLIGASTTIGNYVIPKYLNDFYKKNPNTKISIEINNTEKIINDVNTGKIDFGLIEGLCHNHNIEIIPWQQDNLAIFANADHPLAKKDTVTWECLQKAQWILRESGAGTKEIFEKAIAGKIKELQVKLHLPNTEAVKNAVLAGLGISCLSRYALEKEFLSGKLVELHLPNIDLSRTFYILVHKEKYRNKIFQNCLDFWLSKK